MSFRRLHFKNCLHSFNLSQRFDPWAFRYKVHKCENYISLSSVTYLHIFQIWDILTLFFYFPDHETASGAQTPSQNQQVSRWAQGHYDRSASSSGGKCVQAWKGRHPGADSSAPAQDAAGQVPQHQKSHRGAATFPDRIFILCPRGDLLPDEHPRCWCQREPQVAFISLVTDVQPDDHCSGSSNPGWIVPSASDVSF